MQQTLAMGRDEEEERLQRHVAARLQELCDALILSDPRLTEGEIGRSLGVPNVNTFSTYITGKRKVPFRVLVAASREYGGTLDWFTVGDARYNSPVFEARRLALRHSPPKPRRGKRRSGPRSASKP